MSRFNIGDFEKGGEHIDALPPSPEKAILLCVDGLMTDGGHHKQWYLEQVIIALGEDLQKLKQKLRKHDYDWDDGIAP